MPQLEEHRVSSELETKRPKIDRSSSVSRAIQESLGDTLGSKNRTAVWLATLAWPKSPASRLAEECKDLVVQQTVYNSLRRLKKLKLVQAEPIMEEGQARVCYSVSDDGLVLLEAFGVFPEDAAMWGTRDIALQSEFISTVMRCFRFSALIQIITYIMSNARLGTLNSTLAHKVALPADRISKYVHELSVANLIRRKGKHPMKSYPGFLLEVLLPVVMSWPRAQAVRNSAE